jgi:hypothetical protein
MFLDGRLLGFAKLKMYSGGGITASYGGDGGWEGMHIVLTMDNRRVILLLEAGASVTS